LTPDGNRCAHALGLHRAYLRGRKRRGLQLNKDLTAMTFLAERRRRHQATIDEMLTEIGVRRSR
jgi:hypothetical protein